MVLRSDRADGRVLDAVVGEADRDVAQYADAVLAGLRGDVERHRLGHAVQDEIPGRGGGELLTGGGNRAELDGRAEGEGGLRELVDLHDAAAELAVAPALVARDRGDVDGERRVGDRGPVDRHRAGDLIAATGRGRVEPEEHLVDAVPELGLVGDVPGAVDIDAGGWVSAVGRG